MKRTLTIVVSLIIATVMMAGNVTKEKAEQQARLFLNQHRLAQKAQGVRMVAQRSLPVSVAADATAYYVFNVGSDQGFVIVSGDDTTEPILGYSDQGAFDLQHQPANMQWWLSSYAEQIAAARRQPAANGQARRVPTHAAIQPLMQTTWNQDGAYNQLCPTINDSLTLTGCVATAMAQIIAYHQYPDQVPDMPGYTYAEVNNTDVKHDIDAIDGGTIDWANILTAYTDDATLLQQIAVAKLMRWVGQSVKMWYGPKFSGALSERVAPALINYFGYDQGARFAKRDGYSAEKWDELIYNELAAGRPVYYAGTATGGAHAFVCDGYDGYGLFHINWGWGGSSDGFFRLSVLNPFGSGLGGASTEDGYAMNQEAVIGIQRPTGSTTPQGGIEIDDFTLTEETTVTAKYVNRNTETQTIDYGFQLLDADMKLLSKSTLSAEIGYLQVISAGIDVTEMNLSDGTFYLYPYYALKGQESLNYDPTTYVDIVVSDGKYRMVMHPDYRLKLNSMALASEAVADSTTVLQVSVTNEGDEFNGLYYLFAAQIDAVSGTYLSETSAVTRTNAVIEGGATEETALYCKFKAPGKWRLWLALDTDCKNILGNLDIDVISTTTAVATLTTGRDQATDVYTIVGHRAGRLTPAELSQQPKGIYIVGGRKVIIH